MCPHRVTIIALPALFKRLKPPHKQERTAPPWSDYLFQNDTTKGPNFKGTTFGDIKQFFTAGKGESPNLYTTLIVDE